MTFRARIAASVALTGLALLCTAEPAAAQFYYNRGAPVGRITSNYGYGVPGGYYNPWGWGNSGWGGGDPYGGYLSGAANVINAQGQYLKDTQQAYLTKEQVRGAMIDNRRKMYDEWIYERSNTPTLNETRYRDQQEELRRSLSNPPETEIWSGYALNNMLANAQQMHARGINGPNVPLDSRTLRDINVTVKDLGNVGLLKDAGKLKWPVALRTLTPRSESQQLRETVDNLMVEGKKQAMSGEVDGDLLQQLDKSINTLRGLLKDAVANTSFSDYTASKRYLTDLDQAVKVLKQPDVEKYVGGHYAAKGDSVGELVSYMTQTGLKFSPSTSGEEASYSSLYQSLLRYSLGNGSMYTPPPNNKDPRPPMPTFPPSPGSR